MTLDFMFLLKMKYEKMEFLVCSVINCLPSVLVPSFDLRVRQLKFGREFHPILDT